MPALPPAPPQVRAQVTTPASLRKRRMRGLGGVGGLVLRSRCDVHSQTAQTVETWPFLFYDLS